MRKIQSVSPALYFHAVGKDLMVYITSRIYRILGTKSEKYVYFQEV